MYEKLPEALALAGRMIDEAIPGNDSLFTGKAGSLYYYYHAYRLTNRDIYLEKTKQLAAELCGEVFRQEHKDVSLSTGITGICSVLHILHEQKLLKYLPPEFFRTDESLYTYCMEEKESGSFNFISGTAGIASYFCKRSETALIRKYLNDLVQKLLDTELAEDTTTEINFTLWQGLCGKLSLLFRLLEIFPTNAHIRLRLMHYLHILRSHILQIDAGLNSYSFFPVSADERTGLVQAPNCLFWEAGDLPIVHLLYKAYDAFGDSDYKKLAGVAGAYTLTRRTYDETLVDHAGFAGGACGTGIMYRMIEKASGVNNYHKGYTYWVNQSLVFFNGQLEKNAFEQREHHLTTGLTGLALSWLDHLYADTQLWAELLVP